MKLKVVRLYDNLSATVGMLFIDDVFFCWTLEDEKRIKKVPGETRIPEGEYKVVLRKEGKHHEKYSKMFGDKHYGTLHIVDVPNFKYILIHIGNTEKDTDGCLLVGNSVSYDLKLGQSTQAYERLYSIVGKHLNEGKNVTITFKDIQTHL